MRQKLKSVLALALSLCMILTMAQIPAATSYASDTDGVIDTSVEGYETVRYCTDEEVTAATEKSELLNDFFAGTGTMTWQVSFKTTNSKLQSLLMLDTSSNYYSLYIKSGKIAFESKSVQTISQSTSTTYNDGEWHTAKLEMVRKGTTTIYVDDQVVASADTGSTTCIQDTSWTPTAFTIGGATAYSSASGWALDGSVKDVVLTKTVLAPIPTPVLTAVNPEGGSTSEALTGTANATLEMTWRRKEASTDAATLVSFGTDGQIAVTGDKVVLTYGGASAKIDVANTSLSTTKWHDLAVTTDGAQAEVYVDGVKAGSTAFTGMISGSLTYGTDVYLSEVNVYARTLEEEQIASLQEATLSSDYPDGTEKMEGYEKSDNIEIFNSGSEGSTAYRIPAIATSQKTGTVFASIDMRWNSSADIGVIDSVIKRSEDNGVTWSSTIPVIKLNSSCGYTVDPSLVVDNDENSEHYGRVYMLVDMFQSGTGFSGAQAGTGYTEIDGNYYRVLTDSDGNEYTVREDGIVYDADGVQTSYQVETEAAMPFTTQGDLYKDGVKIGNIFKGSDLVILNTCYLWLTYSDDDGLTWSTPKDITPMVKSDWMKFCGVGPGAGLQLENGRLMFAVYCTNASGVQSSFNVYSDDDGETWHQGGSPNNDGDMENATGDLTESCIVQFDNGHLMQFMRSYNSYVTTSISTDGGLTWSTPVQQTGIKEPYCQLSATHYTGKIVDPEDGEAKEAIIFSNPNSTGRDHGTVRIAFVNEDDTLDWKYSKLIEDGRYCYSSVTVMANGNIGLIYENESYATIGAAFTSFSPEYLMDSNTYENTPVPTSITYTMLDGSGQETTTLAAGNTLNIEVTFSQNVFAAGNVGLTVEVGDETKEAALVGNTSANSLAFTYQIGAEDAGALTITGKVQIHEGGVAETVYNVSLTDKPYVTKDVKVGDIPEDSQFAELSTTGMTATAGSAYVNSSKTYEGPAANVLDGDMDTWWHSNYTADNVSNGGRSKHWVTIDMGAERLVTALLYTPRSGGGNGTVKEYQIEVSTNGTDFVTITSGTWLKNGDVKTADFGGAVLARYVKFRVLETGDEWATAAEIRLVGSTDTSICADKTALLEKINEISAYGDNLGAALGNDALTETVAAAKAIAKNTAATAEEVTGAVSDLDRALTSAASSAKENLQSAITKGEEKKQENYNLTSWTAYKEQLDACKALGANASDAEVLAAYADLLSAEQNLVLSAKGESELFEETKAQAQTALEAAAKDLEAGQGNYTDDSFAAYKEAYEALKAAVESGKGTKVLQSAITALDAAKAALKEKEQEIVVPTPETPATPDNNSGSGSNQTPTTPANPTPVTSTIETGKTYETADGLKYKVTDATKKTVALVGTSKKSTITSLNVKATVKLNNVTCKVTEVSAKAFKSCKKLKKVTIGKNVTTIGKQAFSGCSSLKKVTVKSKVLKNVGAKAFKGINKKAVIKVPKAKKAAYKKLLAKKGQAKTVVIK